MPLLDVLDNYLAVLAEAPTEKLRLDDPDVAEPHDGLFASVEAPGTVSDHE